MQQPGGQQRHDGLVFSSWRGAISAGEAVLDRERGDFAGKSIVSAVDAERVQRWIGVTLSEGVSRVTIQWQLLYRNAIEFALHSAANPKWWESHESYHAGDG